MPEQLDVAYANREQGDLHLDIYRPEGTAHQRAAVLMLHGGGWRTGDRKNLTPHARLLQAAGFTAIPTQYRLLGAAPWPANVNDVKAAIRWVRTHADDLDVDPANVALAGFSAGAHLALVAAGTPHRRTWDGEEDRSGESRVASVAAFYPPTAFHSGEERRPGTSPATGLLGDEGVPEVARSASPITYVSAAYPPTLLIHGGADRVVPTSASVAMHEALRRERVPADLHIYAGQNHAFDHVDVFREVVMAEVALFFRRTMSEREGIDQRTREQSPFARREQDRGDAS